MATCIDVTMTRDMDDKITGWWVDQTYNGSDHNTITFEIKTEKQEEIKSRNWDKGDWPMFTQKLKYVDFHEPEIMMEKKLDRCVQQMYKNLFIVSNETCPKKCRKRKVKTNVWYTKDLKALGYKVKKAYKKRKEKPWRSLGLLQKTSDTIQKIM